MDSQSPPASVVSNARTVDDDNSLCGDDTSNDQECQACIDDDAPCDGIPRKKLANGQTKASRCKRCARMRLRCVAHVESSSRKRTPTRANGNEDIAKTWETQDDEDRPALPAGFVKQWSTQVDNAVAEVKALRNISTTGLARHIVDYTIDSMMSEANAISRAITDANAKDWQSGNDRVASFNMLLRSHQDPVTLNLALNLKMQLMEAELDKSRREADIRDKVTISSALERAENNGSGP